MIFESSKHQCPKGLAAVPASQEESAQTRKIAQGRANRRGSVQFTTPRVERLFFKRSMDIFLRISLSVSCFAPGSRLYPLAANSNRIGQTGREKFPLQELSTQATRFYLNAPFWYVSQIEPLKI